VKRKGSDVTVVGVAGGVSLALAAAATLQREGVSVGVVDPRSLIPLDVDAIAASVERTGRLVVVDPAPRTCGFAGEIVSSVVERCSLRAFPVRVTGADVPTPISPPLERRTLPTQDRVIALFDVGSWGRGVGGNLWRIGLDIQAGPRWPLVSERFEDHGNPEDAGPGGWNDPDMMLIGDSELTTEEQRTHMTLWAMLAAPLLLGNDIRALTSETRDIILNPDVIAVDQDPLGKQGRRAAHDRDAEIWTKPLTRGATAVALFNRGDDDAAVSATWSQLGLAPEQHIRDLWQQTDITEGSRGYEADIPPHGSRLLLLRAATSRD
jgi:hypothetical protein